MAFLVKTKPMMGLTLDNDNHSDASLDASATFGPSSILIRGDHRARFVRFVTLHRLVRDLAFSSPTLLLLLLQSWNRVERAIPKDRSSTPPYSHTFHFPNGRPRRRRIKSTTRRCTIRTTTRTLGGSSSSHNKDGSPSPETCVIAT
jgi:hypothetical protein